MGKKSPFRTFLALMLVACMFLSACTMETTTTLSTVTPIPTCISSTPNPYKSHEPSGAIKIYREYLSGIVPLEPARKEALLRLGENTDHWSEYVDLARDDGQMIRVTITLIDPVLIQYIVLNHALSNAMNAVPMTEEQFNNTVAFVMNRFGEREELLFLVTITSPSYISQAYGSQLLTAVIPFENIELISTSDMRVPHTHDDHNLSEAIPISNGPSFGYIGFPLAISHEGNCVFIMDNWNTTLTLEVPSARLGDKEFGVQSWTLPYYRLVEQSTEHPETAFYRYEKHSTIPFENLSSRISPPSPVWNPNSVLDGIGQDAYWQTYWQDMGRYFWYLVMTESHH